jgi:pyruvate dehydrogenase E2 component (dihydrolipoamide acetyltransferase)
MRFELKMPDLATTGSDIRIVRWLVAAGQKVARGQAILEVETDKAIMEVESVAQGVLQELRAQADEVVSAGQTIAVLEVEEAVRRSAVAGGAGGMFARNRAAMAASTPGAAAPAGAPAWSVAQRVAAQRLQESKQTIPHFYLQAGESRDTNR